MNLASWLVGVWVWPSKSPRVGFLDGTGPEPTHFCTTNLFCKWDTQTHCKHYKRGRYTTTESSDKQAVCNLRASWKPQPQVGSKKQGRTRCDLLGGDYRPVKNGDWKWRPTHSPLDKKRCRSQVNCRPDPGQTMNHEIYYTGHETRSRLQPRSDSMGAQRHKSGGSKPFPGLGMEPGRHVKRGRRSGKKFVEGAGRRESSPRRGMYTGRSGTRGWTVSGIAEEGAGRQIEENNDLWLIGDLVEWGNQGEVE